MKARSFHYHIMFATLFILRGFYPLSVLPSEGIEDVLQSYNAFLRSHADESPRGFLLSLKNYAKEHPTSERAFLQLYEHLLYHRGLDETQSFFENLLQNSAYHRNSYWVLAKINSALDSSSLAFDYYLKALKSGPPSFLLIDDFVLFDHGHNDHFDALAILKRMDLPAWQFHQARALYYRRKLDYEKAVSSAQMALSDLGRDPYLLNLLGLCAYNSLNYTDAEKYWLEGLEAIRESGDLHYEIHYFNNLGLLHADTNRRAKAKAYHEKAIALAESLRDLGRTAFSKANLGAFFWQQGAYYEAFEYFKQAFDISIRILNYNYAGVHAREMAYASRKLGNYSLALESIVKAEKYAFWARNISILFSSLLFKGDLYNHMNLKNLARFEYEKAAQLAEATPFELMSQEAHSRLANFWMDQGEYDRLRKFFRGLIAGKASESYKLFAQFKIGESYFKEAGYDSARQVFLKTYEWGSRLSADTYFEDIAADSRKRIADIKFELGQTDSARQIYAEELINRVAKRREDLKFDQAYALGRVYDKLGHREKAIIYFTDAAKLTETKRENLNVEDFRIGYFSQRSQVYHALARCYFEEFMVTRNPADLKSLFRYTELSRARATKDALLRQPITAVDESELAEYQKACVNLTKIQRRLRAKPELEDSLHVQHEIARFNVIAKRLSVQKPQSGSHDSSVVAFSDILEALKRRNSSLLLYHITNDASFVLATNDNQAEVVRLDIKIDSLKVALDDLLRPFHEVGGQPAQKTAFRAVLAHELYQCLVEPVEKKIQLKQRLLIVPDLALMGLPFEMLLEQAPDAAEYTPKDSPDYAEHFLLHRYSISYSPSTWLLTTSATKGRDNPKLLVLANPFRFDIDPSQQYTKLELRSGWRFNFLWFAEEEADRIKEKYSTTRIYKQDDANEERLKQEAANCQILHFATHAFVDTVFDAFSGLVLAPGGDSTHKEQADDGLLMGYEIADQRFNCDLVTLSACETGRGQMVAGEGVLGLPRLFFGAGVKSVLMTLWKVDDKFASDLMPKFYDYLLNQQLSKADALAKAKRLMLSLKDPEHGVHYQHPFYWASFTLFGNPGVSKITQKQTFIFFVALAVILILALIVVFYRRYYRPSAK